MNFEQVDEMITTYADGLLCDIETKRRAKKNMIDIIALACKVYVNDDNFKKEIDDYIKYRKLEIKYR